MRSGSWMFRMLQHERIVLLAGDPQTVLRPPCQLVLIGLNTRLLHQLFLPSGVNPRAAFSVTQTVDGPTPNQTVLANVSGGTDVNSVGTSIVQNPDGTISTQGTTFSEGAGWDLSGPWQVQVPLSSDPSTPQEPYSGPYTVPTAGGSVDINPDSCYCVP